MRVIVHDQGTTRKLEIKPKPLSKKPVKTYNLRSSGPPVVPPKKVKPKSREVLKVTDTKADSWKEKIRIIRDQVGSFKVQLQAKNIAQACIIAEEIINAHGAEFLMPWQHILKGFYGISPELARQYVEKGRTLLSKSFIPEFNRTCAALEYQYGDIEVGKSLYNDIIKENPHRIGPIISYATCMLKNENVTAARELFINFKKFCTNEDNFNKQIATLEKQFHCYLR